ncbi:energy transducer TonB [Chrysiogenes arsenatis]|uniref:energy transducer TonB n=1 Tax=Chrysiogenes arsenatis TaxID=309797 RepID=UPI0004881FA3|nr:energy transducer TonB [Chrysiogenes arsenatis]
MKGTVRQLPYMAAKACLALLLTTLLFCLFLHFNQRTEIASPVEKGVAMVLLPLQPAEPLPPAFTVPELPVAPQLPTWQKAAPPKSGRTAEPLPVQAPTLSAHNALPVHEPQGDVVPSTVPVPINVPASPPVAVESTVFDLKDVDGKPRLLSRVVPEYPRYAFENRIEGEVLATFTLDVDGSVRDLRIIKANPPNIFEAAVVAALMQWKFAAATKDGNTVAVRMLVPLTFTLER